MSLRLKRLTAERDQLVAAFAGSRRISVEPDQGDPPERYQVIYRVKGLELTTTGEVVSRSEHIIEIVLPADYPRRPPICKMRTPIFHPNIDRSDICTSDHWSAQETLVDLVVRIGQMIAFQSYNAKSPLNADAARWCEENQAKLPVDSSDLHPAEPEAVTAERAMRSSIAAAEEGLRRVGQAASVDMAKSVVADAVRHLAGVAPRAVQGDGGSLSAKRDALIVSALRLDQALKELSQWEERNAKAMESLRVFVRLRDCVASAGGLLSQLGKLPAPAWHPGGHLNESQVIGAAEGLRAERARLTAALLAAQTTLEAHALEFAVEAPPDLPVELHAVAVASPSELAAFAPLAGRRSVVDTAATVVSRLDGSASCLDWLCSCIRRHRTLVEVRSLVENLSRFNVDSCDGIEVRAAGASIQLRAGERSSLPGIGSVTCRVPSAGGIELRDAKGELVCLMQGLGTEWALTTRSGVEARLLVPDAKSAHSACASALRRLEGASPSESLPVNIDGVNWPHWMADLRIPDLRNEVSRLRTDLESSQRSSVLRFWVSRLRTVTLEMRDWQKVGGALAKELVATAQASAAAEGALKEVIASGKVQKNGVLRFNAEQMAQFEQLQIRVPALQQRARSLVASLLAHNSRLKPVSEKAEKLLRQAPSNSTVQATAMDLRIALSEVIAKAKEWSEHAPKGIGSRTSAPGAGNE